MNKERKVILYIATSIDGYIARNNDELDWLDETTSEGDNGYSEFLSTIDTVIMGNKTYEVIKDFGVDYPYKDCKSYVYSATKHGSDENVEYINMNVNQFINNLKNEKGKDIWLVGGASLAKDFFKNSLIDELIITIAPVILGDGISLYKDIDVENRFKLKCSKTYGDFVSMHYIKSNSIDEFMIT